MKYIFGTFFGRTRRSESGPPLTVVLSPLATHEWHLAAYSAMFLSRLIVYGKPIEAPRKVLFPLATKLSLGHQIPLVTFTLGNLYSWLDKAREDCYRSMGHFIIDNYAPLLF